MTRRKNLQKSETGIEMDCDNLEVNRPDGLGSLLGIGPGTQVPGYCHDLPMGCPAGSGRIRT